MKSVNCRYSDCQFSITPTPNSDEVRYRINEILGSPWRSCSSLKSACPATAWNTSAARNSPRKTSDRPLCLTNARTAQLCSRPIVETYAIPPTINTR
jgi:hypothetical protein